MADGYLTSGILANAWIWTWAYKSSSKHWEGSWIYEWWSFGGFLFRPILLLLDGTFLEFFRGLRCLHSIRHIQIVRNANAILLAPDTPDTPPLVRSLAITILTKMALAQQEVWALLSVPQIYELFPRIRYESKYLALNCLKNWVWGHLPFDPASEGANVENGASPSPVRNSRLLETVVTANWTMSRSRICFHSWKRDILMSNYMRTA